MPQPFLAVGIDGDDLDLGAAEIDAQPIALRHGGFPCSPGSFVGLRLSVVLGRPGRRPPSIARGRSDSLLGFAPRSFGLRSVRGSWSARSSASVNRSRTRAALLGFAPLAHSASALSVVLVGPVVGLRQSLADASFAPGLRPARSFRLTLLARCPNIYPGRRATALNRVPRTKRSWRRPLRIGEVDSYGHPAND